ncbi:MAG: DUF58 domain-containing protein [Thiotrichaceae bacterium]|nr:DUF58 domain-containing protein [Thiotrichaceae bacterium]
MYTNPISRYLHALKARIQFIPPQSHVKLGRRRIYIMPSRYGIWFTSTLLVMLFGAINYNNSLGYLLTFLLTSLGLVSILYTYRNLAGLSVEVGKAQAVFVGEMADFKLLIDNQGQAARYALNWQLAPAPNFWKATETSAQSSVVEVEENKTILVSIKVLAQERGYFPLGLVTVFTRYPLGLFHAWAILNLDMKALVYPAPLGQSLLPASSLQEVMGESTLQSGSGEDFLGYRAYQLGDSPRHIAWKVEARDQGTFIKQFGGTGSPMLWLDWKQVSHLASTETALSQLALWVVLADKQGACYGLRLPDVEIPPSHGDQHRVRCLQALALFGKNP